jgi:protein associated with RNAse G/E
MDELEEHSKLFNYPDNLKEKILQVAQDLKEKTAAGYFDKFYDLNLLTNGK